MSNATFLSDVNAMFDKAAANLDMPDGLAEKIRVCNTTFVTRFGVRLRGRMHTFVGWRSEHSSHNRPTKGGIRFQPDATQDEVEALAALMSYKCALMRLPFGGSKGALAIDPREWTEAELERITRRFAQELIAHNFLGAATNVPAPDVGTGEKHMMWIADEYRRQCRNDINAMGSVTGKPVTGDGIEGRTEATGRGVQFAIREFFRHPEDLRRAGFQSDHLRDRSVIVQGLGNVGYHAALFLSQEDGCRIIKVIERDGVVEDTAGIDIIALRRHMDETGGVSGFPGAIADDGHAIEGECDILIPAAKEGVIHGDNAGRIGARLVVEAANGPISYEGDRILTARGIVIIPDLFANAGGVVVSYFEWVKNLTHIPFGLMDRRSNEDGNRFLARTIEQMTGQKFPVDQEAAFVKGRREIDLVRSGLDDIIRSAYSEMSTLWKAPDNGIDDLRTAAYTIAVSRISDAYRAIGI